jgi:hypothetical protein
MVSNGSFLIQRRRAPDLKQNLGFWSLKRLSWVVVRWFNANHNNCIIFGVWGMPIPALMETGYLPSGEFHCDLVELRNTFGVNDRRTALLAKLDAFLGWLRNTHGLDLPYFIDGSYTTSKPYPGDIDFVIDLSNATDEQIGTALVLFSLHQAQIKQDFEIDFWFFHPNAQKDLKQFFQYVRIEELQQRQLPPETRKGILRISP